MTGRVGGRNRLPLALVLLCAGFSTSLVAPFLALFLSTAVRAGAGPDHRLPGGRAGRRGVRVLGGGRISDRPGVRRRLLIAAALAGLAGTALTAVIRDYPGRPPARPPRAASSC